MNVGEAAASTEDGAVDTDQPRWRSALHHTLVTVFVLVLLIALGVALTRLDWGVVAVVFAERDRGQVSLLLGGAFLASTIGLAVGFFAWHAMLLELGPPVDPARAVRVFFVSFLSKYVPGKVPGLVASARVATANGVSLARFIGAGLLTMCLVVLTGLTIGLLAGIQVLGRQVLWLAVAALLIVLVLVRPQLVNLAVRVLLRVFRRPELTRRASPAGVRRAVLAQSLSWLITGVHLWLLAVAMGAAPARSLALCVGAFSLATTVGVLAVVIPDGIGVREAVLTAALALVLPTPVAAVVAVASRLVSTVSEVVLGAAALGVAEVMVRRARARDPAPVLGPAPVTD